MLVGHILPCLSMLVGRRFLSVLLPRPSHPPRQPTRQGDYVPVTRGWSDVWQSIFTRQLDIALHLSGSNLLPCGFACTNESSVDHQRVTSTAAQTFNNEFFSRARLLGLYVFFMYLTSLCRNFFFCLDIGLPTICSTLACSFFKERRACRLEERLDNDKTFT